MISEASPLHTSAVPDWIGSVAARRICERISHVFPMSPDTSVHRAARRAFQFHGPDAHEDVLVRDAVRLLWVTTESE